MRVLHTLSQRPQQTGSGITLDELIHHGNKALYNQEVIVGVPANGPYPNVGGLPPSAIHQVKFGEQPLNFPVPGMSDVMPYESSRWSSLTKEQLTTYKTRWCEVLTSTVNKFRPSLIHTNHIWLLSSLLKELFPQIPVVAHCHATGLRQMELCPHLKEDVIKGCRAINAFAVLHSEHRDKLSKICNIDPSKIHIVGAGFNPGIFKVTEGTGSKNLDPLTTTEARVQCENSIINVAYAGKYSLSKGLSSLLDAIELINRNKLKIVLHVAGSGSGSEAVSLKQRMVKMTNQVIMYGQVDQVGLSAIFNRCSLIALTSFYEGLPLVLIEALSCGCQIVSTKLPGVVNELVPWVGDYISLVDLPPMTTIDKPLQDGLKGFAEDIADTLIKTSEKSSPKENNKLKKDVKTALDRFTWDGVFRRVEEIWTKVTNL